MDFARAHYDDGSVACDETGLAIRRYYPWGERRIPYGQIRDVSVLPLTTWTVLQPWRIWGPADLEHWWNLDTHRTTRQVALVVDTGERFKPTVTPVDPEGFETVIRAHLNGLQELREQSAIARLTAGRRLAIPQQRGDAPIAPNETRNPAGHPHPRRRRTAKEAARTR